MLLPTREQARQGAGVRRGTAWQVTSAWTWVAPRNRIPAMPSAWFCSTPGLACAPLPPPHLRQVFQGGILGLVLSATVLGGSWGEAIGVAAEAGHSPRLLPTSTSTFLAPTIRNSASCTLDVCIRGRVDGGCVVSNGLALGLNYIRVLRPPDREP